MAEGAEGELGAVLETARAGVAGVDVPAEAASGGEGGRGLDGGHELHGFRFKELFAVKGAAVEQHAGEAGEIGRGGEEPGVTGDALGFARARVVHDAAQRLAVGDGGGRDTGVFGDGRIVAGVGHAEGLENFLRAKCIEPLVGDAPDDFIEQLKIDVAVNEFFAGLGAEFFGDAFGDALGVAFPAVHGDVGSQSAGVGEQVAEGDSFASVAGEFGKVFFNRVVNAQAAALVEEHHGGGGGDDLGERGGVVNGVWLGGGVDGLDAGFAVGLGEVHAVALEPEHTAG